MSSAQQALDFLLEKEKTCNDQELFIFGYVISIVSLLDASDNFEEDFTKMVQSTIKQDQLSEQDQAGVLSLVQSVFEKISIIS
ncbi:hypothetical protein [Marinicellulosiphila megalodicopiae]|uniref:hypothetical protein n=1 Tax=Marinicellulosiphila megalodicopiae TaxID=2724896 RepID=UPI003BAF3610